MINTRAWNGGSEDGGCEEGIGSERGAAGEKSLDERGRDGSMSIEEESLERGQERCVDVMDSLWIPRDKHGVADTAKHDASRSDAFNSARVSETCWFAVDPALRGEDQNAEQRCAGKDDGDSKADRACACCGSGEGTSIPTNQTEEYALKIAKLVLQPSSVVACGEPGETLAADQAADLEQQQLEQQQNQQEPKEEGVVDGQEQLKFISWGSANDSTEDVPLAGSRRRECDDEACDIHWVQAEIIKSTRLLQRLQDERGPVKYKFLVYSAAQIDEVLRRSRDGCLPRQVSRWKTDKKDKVPKRPRGRPPKAKAVAAV